MSFSIFFGLEATAQNEKPKQKDSSQVDLIGLLLSSYSFEKPTEEFIELVEGGGYTCDKYKAAIRYVIVPGKLGKLREEYKNLKLPEYSILIDTSTHRLNEREYLVMVTEEISFDEKKQENYIMVSVASEQNDVVVFVVGAYPKSHDAMLRKSFIQSGYTIKKD